MRFLRVLQSRCPRLHVGIIMDVFIIMIGLSSVINAINTVVSMDEQFIRNTFALQLTKYCASFVENCF